MIHIVYDRPAHRITIKGHSHSAEKGHDLVCASVSALAYTAAQNAIYLQEKGYARFVSTKLNEGNGEVVCVPKCRYEAGTDLILSAVCVGFEILSKSHPEEVSYEVKG